MVLNMNFLRIRQFLVPMELPVFSNKNRKASQKGNLVSVNDFMRSAGLYKLNKMCKSLQVSVNFEYFCIE